MSGELIIGLMSGTSADGIDAALVEFQSESQLRVVETHFAPFNQELQVQINDLALKPEVPTPNEYAKLHAQLAHCYASASKQLLQQSGLNTRDVQAIANHGQTIAHQPTAKPPFSLQIGDSQALANLSGITTISQFRQADLALGGQGAPLMPAFHKAIFCPSPSGEKNGNGEHRLILNLGGIANITALGDNTIGFDTGPANTLLNQWIQLHKGESFDKNGAWSTSGTIISGLLDSLLADPYFSLPFPKSTGTDYFSLKWLDQHLGSLSHHAKKDIQATLLALSVQSIALSLQQLGVQAGSLFVCGGGVRNTAFMHSLAETLPSFSIQKTDVLGVPSDWVEAVGFAWLGYCNLHHIPSNLPSVTGASDQIVLGERFEPKLKRGL